MKKSICSKQKRNPGVLRFIVSLLLLVGTIAYFKFVNPIRIIISSGVFFSTGVFISIIYCLSYLESSSRRSTEYNRAFSAELQSYVKVTEINDRSEIIRSGVINNLNFYTAWELIARDIRDQSSAVTITIIALFTFDAQLRYYDNNLVQAMEMVATIMVFGISFFMTIVVPTFLECLSYGPVIFADCNYFKYKKMEKELQFQRRLYE